MQNYVLSSKKARNLSLPLNIMLTLFNVLVKPVVCIYMGQQNCDILERLQLRFFKYVLSVNKFTSSTMVYGVGRGPRVVVSTAAFHARVLGSVPGLGGLKETKMFLPHPRVKVRIVGSLRDREVACSASDRQGLNFESCVWRTVSSQSPRHPQEVLLAQFSLYVHKGGLKPESFLFLVYVCWAPLPVGVDIKSRTSSWHIGEGCV